MVRKLNPEYMERGTPYEALWDPESHTQGDPSKLENQSLNGTLVREVRSPGKDTKWKTDRKVTEEGETRKEKSGHKESTG